MRMLQGGDGIKLGLKQQLEVAVKSIINHAKEFAFHFPTENLHF